MFKAQRFETTDEEERIEDPGTRVIMRTTELLKERFEDGPAVDRLSYHNHEHTGGVFTRAEKIAKAMGLSEREQLLVQVAAAFHDTVQEWDEAKREDGTSFRKRRIGDNEKASAEEALAWMRAQKDIAFTEKECALVQEAIRTTIPDFDTEHNTVVQKRLHADSHPVARALALADIGAPGMEPARFMKDAQALFAEEEIEVMSALKNAESAAKLSVDTKEKYLARYRTWLERQVAFVKGRKALFEFELGKLEDGAKQAVRALFSGFEDSLKQAEEAAHDAQALTFEDMVQILTTQV